MAKRAAPSAVFRATTKSTEERLAPALKLADTMFVLEKRNYVEERWSAALAGARSVATCSKTANVLVVQQEYGKIQPDTSFLSTLTWSISLVMVMCTGENIV